MYFSAWLKHKTKAKGWGTQYLRTFSTVWKSHRSLWSHGWGSGPLDPNDQLYRCMLHALFQVLYMLHTIQSRITTADYKLPTSQSLISDFAHSRGVQSNTPIVADNRLIQRLQSRRPVMCCCMDQSNLQLLGVLSLSGTFSPKIALCPSGIVTPM